MITGKNDQLAFNLQENVPLAICIGSEDGGENTTGGNT